MFLNLTEKAHFSGFFISGYNILTVLSQNLKQNTVVTLF